MRDSTTKAARRKCHCLRMRILSKQSKAFELMQQGTEGEILVQISPLLFSRGTEYIFSPQLVPYLPLSLVLFSSPSMTMEVKQINPPMSPKQQSLASLSLWPPFLSFTLFLFSSLFSLRCALHCYSITTPMTVR